MKVRPLEVEIVKRGFVYNQIQRNSIAAIYSQTYDDKLIAYETIVIKTSPPHFSSTDKTFDLIELYPGENQFGINGWSYVTLGNNEKALQKAKDKFNLITQQHEKR